MTQRFTAADGIGIAYYRWGTPGALPPVVLQHGFVANTQANWVLPGVVEALLAAGREVISVDARGHGESDKPYDSRFYGEETMSGDLRALFDLLELDSVHLVGYSMGGIVSLLTAAADVRVSRLVVGGIGVDVTRFGDTDTRTKAGQAVAAVLLAEDPVEVDPLAGRFRELADQLGSDRQALAAQANAMHDKPIRFADIAAPTLVIAGAEDPLAQRPETIANAMPDARTLVLDGCDHLSAVVDKRFAPAIVDFLS